MKTREESAVNMTASPTSTFLCGNSQPRVGGLSASSFLSVRRLKPMAALLASTMAIKIQTRVPRLTGWVGQAKAPEARAKTVWEKRTRRP